jgi:hypothetical protein
MLGDVRSKSRWITHKWWHPMARILWALTQRIMELHEDIWDMCWISKTNKKSESTQGNLDDVWHKRRNCEKMIQATDHWRLFAFNSERPFTMKSSKAKGIKLKLRGEKSYPKEFQTRASPSPNLKNGRRCFHQLEDLVRHVQGRKSWKSEAPSSVGSNASKIDEFEDPYKEIWQKHWAMCSLKSACTDCSAGVERA